MTRRAVLWSLLAVVAGVAAASGAVDTASQAFAEKALNRALVTFAVARTLNGVISVAQGTEIAIEPAGVGVTMTVGQVLDPVNDLVERFSGVMLVAASSLGLQRILLEISAWWGATAALALAAAGVVLCAWVPALANGGRAETVLRVFLVLVFARFAVPLLTVGTNLVFDAFLAAPQEAATAALEATQTEVERLEEPARALPGEGASWVDRLSAAIGDSLSSMRVAERLERLEIAAARASEHIVSLIAIFVLQTILLPLAFLWLFVQLLRGVATRFRDER